jgi:hypothetical protein
VHKKYHDQGVVFIGLTHEDVAELPKSQAFLDAAGITWLNGYGALDTLLAFESVTYPTMWVIGTDGKVVWNSDSPGTLEEGIEEALSSMSKN